MNLLDRALAEAWRLHRRGELAAAEAAYRRILAQHPENPSALHGFGLLALQVGRPDIAIGTIGQAARLAPDHAAYHLDLGLALKEGGHLEQARAAFHVAALLDPGDATPRAAMADMLVRLHRPADAAASYREALDVSPHRADVMHALGLVQKTLGRHRDAVGSLRGAVAAAPSDLAFRNDLAGALLDVAEPAAAESELRIVLAAEPGHAGALNNLGLALQDLERPDEALAAFDHARRAAPDDLDILNNAGVALRDLDRAGDALACFDAVLARNPEHAAAHLNAASVRLMQGDFARGWEEFEWRDRVAGASPRTYAVPRWQGEDLAGRTLLVHAEMGLGDTIQFCRFLPRLAGRVLLQAPASVARLLASLSGVEVLTSEPAANIDLHCPLLSLPRLLGVRVADLPAARAYLRADPADLARWAARVASLPGRRIGVCWAGSAAYAQDRRRSLPSSKLAPLADIAGVSLVSLQQDRAPEGVAMTDWTAELSDLADTAALIEALDVVVSVDTAVAHLAASLGKPVLLLDRFAGDWRWMRGRSDSPWYPSLRIVRQPAAGDWDSVLAELARLLS